jgi:hypothetical protein
MGPSVTAHLTDREALPVNPAEVLEQLRRLLGSPQLKESHQLQAFLEFIVRETLAGHADALKEYLLGCRVFGRKPDYDPRIDGIVRVQATVLRKRLEKYYAGEGSGDVVIIDLPRGGYVPSFRVRHAEPMVEAALPEVHVDTAPAVKPVTMSSGRVAVIAFLLGCAVMAGVGWIALKWNAKPVTVPFMVTTATPADCPQLWGAFFARGANNLVAYGVPLFFSAQGVYLRDVGVNSPGEGDQTRVNQFSKMMHATLQPMDDLYTGVGELEATYRLSNFFASHGMPVSVRNARTLGTSDLSGHNIVAVSSLRFQTLLRELHLPEVFIFQPTSPEAIANLKYLPGEEQAYVFRQGAGVSTSYAVVSLWPGTTAGSRIMHVGGVHTWATQAAVEFLLQPEQLRLIAGKFESDSRTGARGTVSPYFQILLRVEGRGNQSHRVEYVTHHYLPADLHISGS